MENFDDKALQIGNGVQTFSFHRNGDEEGFIRDTDRGFKVLKIFPEFPASYSAVPSAVAVGAFDGVHLGHQKVLSIAADSGFCPVAVTFATHPQASLKRAPPRLSTHAVKRRAMQDAGVQFLLELDFNRYQNCGYTDFFELLREKLNAKLIVCGQSFRFGKGGQGTPKTLAGLCEQSGVRLEVAQGVCVNDQPVSSTAVRFLIASGDIKTANAMLGRPFSFDFTVGQGDRRGRSFSIPTLNQPFPPGFVLPRFGVYVSDTKLNNEWRRSVTNIGIRPTYRTKTPAAETHVLGFCGDVYGQDMEVRLQDYLRPERVFASDEELKAVISKDIEAAANWAANGG
jgi:riboflavin kinase/FMN adenylyltransferase